MIGPASVLLAAVAAALALPTLVRVDRASRLWLLATNFFGTAWAPYVAVAGACAVAGGLAGRAPLAVALGLVPLTVGAAWTWAVTRPNDAAFARAFGADWRQRVAPAGSGRRSRRRWRWGLPRPREARHEPDVSVTAEPDGALTGLSCDLWFPLDEAGQRSGVVVIYLHGGAWYLMDKDVGTRRLFRYLCAAGHVVVDLDYRMCPEVDARGMVHDAMRTVAWVKRQAPAWGARADRVVLVGASAGGHVALLAAYGADDRALRPGELDADHVSVAGVVSYYGIVDLLAYDAFARRFQPETGHSPPPSREPPDDFTRRVFRSLVGRDLDPKRLPPLPPHWVMMRELVAGGASPSPGQWEAMSPLHRIHVGCPPTLHFQPEFDHLQPVEAGRAFRDRLAAAGVPIVYVEFPRTLHAFDLLAPPLVSPAAQSALVDLDLFLNLLASSPEA